MLPGGPTPMARSARFLGFLSTVLLLVGVASGAPPTAPSPPTGAVTVPVEGDVPAFALPAEGDSRQVIVYLPGRCGDPFAGLRSFPEAARRFGTMLVVNGDLPCPHRPGRRSWSTSAAKIQARIDAALQAASARLERPLDSSALTLLGYSEGALRAELVSGAFPQRYPRVLLGGEPRAPSPTNFRPSQSVATLAGQLDTQAPMRDGAAAISKAGIPARFWLLPGARHGQYGPEGNRVLGEAFAWLFGQHLGCTVRR